MIRERTVNFQTGSEKDDDPIVAYVGDPALDGMPFRIGLLVLPQDDIALLQLHEGLRMPLKDLYDAVLARKDDRKDRSVIKRAAGIGDEARERGIIP